ncbi:MAG: hypothetical protein ACOYEA_07590 [Fermentimonas sp.]|jgi:hypothetical protein
MNSYNKIYRYCIGLVVLPLLWALMGCEDIIFDKDADCPTPTDKRIVRITATVLAPAGGGSSTRSAMSNTLRAAKDFLPNEQPGSDFENQIATLRVIGFYAEDQGEKKAGDVAFNKIFADSDILNELGWTIKDGVETLIKHPVGSNVSLEFETDVAGEFDVVLIANESLAAAASMTVPANYQEPLMTLVDKETLNDEEKKDVDNYRYDMNGITNIDDLKKVFITTTYNFIYKENIKPEDFSGWESAYRGAVPKELLTESNGGIPMVGQGEITLSRNTPSSTGSNSVTSADINLERVMAKLELNISNTDINDAYDPEIFPEDLHISSIRVNNYPMYAMLLPSMRSETDKDYATPGTEHIYYSDPNTPFMDMYRAEEKTIKSSDGWNWNIIPLTPKAYNSVEKATKENFFKPSYILYPHFATSYYLWYNWVYYCMPGVVIYKDGSVGQYKDGTINLVPRDSYGRSYKPLEVYMLPTTNEIMPDKMAYGTVEPGNGIADMKHAPTEVIVRIGRYIGDFADISLETNYISYIPSVLMNNDEAIADHHFLLFNQDANKTDDKYAIRRNTIYRMNLTWEGKKLYLAYPDGTKVLPWKTVEEEILDFEI